MYSSGATILPVYPIYKSFEQYPASTEARVAPTPAPKTSASSSIILKFSCALIALPALTILLADAKSGLSDYDSSSLTNVLRFGYYTSILSCSISTGDCSGFLSKAVGLTVRILGF